MIPVTDPDGNGQRLTSGHQKTSEVKGGMGTPILYSRALGYICADLGDVLFGVSPGDAPFWVRDVGGDPPYG